jgi:alkylation response protein AidB-like acyl-CoA dehydrogenase
MSYAAPIADMRFVLDEIAGLGDLAQLPGLDGAAPEIIGEALSQAGRLAGEVLAPLNQVGDRTGSKLENGVVRTPEGFRDAYGRFVEGGWNAVPFDPDYGGQGLPWAVATAFSEMWNAANMSFALCPLLNQGAIDLLSHHGSADQKARYLHKMVSGEWTGTMNLTEPQAGSDVGALKTRAVPDGAGWRITGQKIFITYGEHDFTDNIVHMVLARTPDAPPGTKGISLFIVPKFVPEGDGRPAGRNDLRVVSLEHKLGIHASPTCVMAFGDGGGAWGELVGEPNRGMEYMFTMMNNARLTVGLQGLAIADRAYQRARDFARVRVQSRDIAGSKTAVPIIRHPDIRRMLMTMRAGTEAMRSLAYYTAAGLDRARVAPDAEVRRQWQSRVDLLIPVVKAWSTDLGCEIASLGVQVHGGMGFIEETGAAQHMRDARIAPIYEGTNGIQALDLIGRKLGRDGGAAARDCLGDMADTLDEIEAHAGEAGGVLSGIHARLAEDVMALDRTTDWMVRTMKEDPRRAAASATPYCNLFGYVAGGWLMARGALAAARRLGAGDPNTAFLQAKLTTARFYAQHYLSRVEALVRPIVEGADSVLALAEDDY